MPIFDVSRKLPVQPCAAGQVIWPCALEKDGAAGIGTGFSECVVGAREHGGWRDKLRNAIPCYLSGVAAQRRTGLHSVLAAPSRLTSSSPFGRDFSLRQRYPGLRASWDSLDFSRPIALGDSSPGAIISLALSAAWPVNSIARTRGDPREKYREEASGYWLCCCAEPI